MTFYNQHGHSGSSIFVPEPLVREEVKHITYFSVNDVVPKPLPTINEEPVLIVSEDEVKDDIKPFSFSLFPSFYQK